MGVLIGYDGSADAPAAVAHAGQLMPGSDATILVIWERASLTMIRMANGAWDWSPQTATTITDRALEKAALKTASDRVRRATAAGLMAQPRIVNRHDDMAAAILAAAGDVDADVIVGQGRSTGPHARRCRGRLWASGSSTQPDRLSPPNVKSTGVCMAYTPTDQPSSPSEPASEGDGQFPDGYASSVPPARIPVGEHPRLIEEHHIVGPHGEDEIEATDERGRRWYHLRPEPRRRVDFIGFNYTWWLIWVVFIFVIFLPWGRGWGY